MTDPELPRTSQAPRSVIVSGLSGAGKSQALKVLEDLGYFCVDNLPLPLLENFLDFCGRSGHDLAQVAIGMDIRGRSDLTELSAALERLRERGIPLEILFLEADDRTLLSRFRESRRPHPLEAGGQVLTLISREREALAPLRASADWIIDTSALTVHDFRRKVMRQFDIRSPDETLLITLCSFGYKYGSPIDADLVLDVRFLPNPYFVPGLKELDGRNAQVASYVLDHEVTREFLVRLWSLLDFLLPQYEREGKTYLTIAIGCTGGHHRSVAIVEEIRSMLSGQGKRVEVRHRDLQ